MYFDDCEREDNVNRLSQPQEQTQHPWIPSEKELYLARVFPSYHSSLKLDDELFEEETLRWAIDTNILWDGDEETKSRSKYLSLSDLIVDSSCSELEHCLATIWRTLSSLLENKNVNSVHWLVFPRCQAMWDYDTMVAVLQAIKVSSPQLEMEVGLDLFHPKYKNAPTMFSPGTHSPFPTVSLQVRDSQPQFDDASVTVAKLQALFDSVDAVETTERRPQSPPKCISPDKVLQDSHLWWDAEDSAMEWVVESHQQPFMIYAKLWEIIHQIRTRKSSSSAMVVAPNLDAHTQHRIAVTVQAALQHLDSRIRIVNVYHPDDPADSRKSPHPIIQLTHK